MSLFGAATSGVDPQTGSYLTKEQRVAMFRASQGRGVYGGGGGSGGDSGKKKRSVDPQSSIVVVNKMTDVVQKLQTNFQDTTETVSGQAVENKKNIEDLYKLISAQRTAELKEEQAETLAARKDRENLLRKARERLVEGVSSAFAGLANFGKGIADKVISPAKGFFDKLKEALGWLAAALAIQNLPAILNAIDGFITGLPELKEKLIEGVKNVRGPWSILDRALRGVKSLIGRIARTAWNLARRIATAGFNIAKKIIGSVFNFTKRVVGGVVEKIGDFVGRQLGILKRGIQRVWNGFIDSVKKIRLPNPFQRPGGGGASPDAPKLPPGADDAVDAATDAKPKGNWFTRTFDKGKKFFQKGITSVGDVFKSGQKNLAKLGGNIQSGFQKTKDAIGGALGSVKPNSEAAKAGWIQKALEPLKKIPVLESVIGGLKGGLKGIGKLLARMPVIGFAIDLALNTGVEGQDWTEAIIRALLSSTTGALGAAAGAKVGGGIGAGLGTLVFPVGGTVVGGALGAGIGGILGGILAGAIGDKVGGVTYENLTGMEATPNKPLGSGFADMVTDSVTGFIGAPKIETKAEARGEIPEHKQPAPEPVVQPSSPVVAEEDGILGGVDRVVKTVGSMIMTEPSEKVEPKDTAVEPLKGKDAVEAVAPTEQPKVDTPATAPSPRAVVAGESTPDGMSLSSRAQEGVTKLNTVELPPVVTDLTAAKKLATPKGTTNAKGRSTPSYSTKDEETDIYRGMAYKIYQLLG